MMGLQLLTKKQVANICSTSTRTVERWVSRGWLPTMNCNSRFVRFRLSDVENFVRLHLKIPKEAKT